MGHGGRAGGEAEGKVTGQEGIAGGTGLELRHPTDGSSFLESGRSPETQEERAGRLRQGKWLGEKSMTHCLS